MRAGGSAASQRGGQRTGPPYLGFDALRTLAVSRIYLDNFDHITAYCVGLGHRA